MRDAQISDLNGIGSQTYAFLTIIQHSNSYNTIW